MPRLARTVAVGCAHHITQRGNNRQDVFFVDDDRRVYLELLKQQADKYGLDVDGYCLMNNHIHLIAIPHTGNNRDSHLFLKAYLGTPYNGTKLSRSF